MKSFRTFIATMLLMAVQTAATAQPMTYVSMCDNARFLTDRMAYTLGVTSMALIDDLYRINFDYICGVSDYLDDVALGYRYDDYMAVCYERDRALQRLLGYRLWTRILGIDYFYRPISFVNRCWSFGIYAHDRYHNHYYCSVPTYYHSYRGGHFFHGMRPGHSRSYHIERPIARPGEPRRYMNGGGSRPGYSGNASRPQGNYNGGTHQRPQGNGGNAGTQQRPQGNNNNYGNNSNYGNNNNYGGTTSRPQGGMNSGSQRPQRSTGMNNPRSASQMSSGATRSAGFGGGNTRSAGGGNRGGGGAIHAGGGRR